MIKFSAFLPVLILSAWILGFSSISQAQVEKTLLDSYTVVNRGGYFPENKNISRNKQITWSEAVYRIYTLPNGTELVLYRSPSQNTAEYVIRKQ